MASSQDFKTIQERLQGALVTTTKTVNRLRKPGPPIPTNGQPSVERCLDEHGERLAVVRRLDLLDSKDCD